MKNFLIVRVPVLLDINKNPLRRPNFGAAPVVVGEADTRGEVASKVGAFSFGDKRNHYYGLEVVATGEPDRKTAIPTGTPKPPKGSRLKLAVNNEKKEKKA